MYGLIVYCDIEGPLLLLNQFPTLSQQYFDSPHTYINTEHVTDAANAYTYLAQKPDIYCCICPNTDRLGSKMEIQLFLGQCVKHSILARFAHDVCQAE